MSVDRASATDASLRPTMWDGFRWRIALLLGVGVLVNFFDRVNLSVAVTELRNEFHLSTVAIGYLLSTYSWTYILLQLPSGPLLDRFGVKRVGRVSTLLWSIASFLTAAAKGFGGLIAARLLLGVAEAPTFPGNVKAIAAWFPAEERGLPTAIFDAAAKFASAVGIPIVAVIVHYWGWRASLIATGLISLAYFGLFCAIYRDAPGELTAAGNPRTPARPLVGSASLLFLLRRKKVWGLALGMAAYNYNFYLFLTWLPGYLNSALHLDILRSGLYTAVPWLTATVADLVVGGWLVDQLVRKGRDSTSVRRCILIVGLGAGLAIAGAARTANPAVAIASITIALSGLAASAPVGWSIAGLIAPAGSAGRVGGIVNFVANLPGILAPVITGYLVGNTQSFTRAFLVAAAVLIGGICSYVFLLGRIETIPVPFDAALFEQTA